MIHRGNFSRGRKEKLLDIPLQDGDIVKGNFAQVAPHTDMATYFNGKQVVVEGNGLNCDFPINVAHMSGLGSATPIHKSLCTHIHEELGNAVDPCPEDCEHVIDSDELIVDGVSLGTSYLYEDKIV